MTTRVLEPSEWPRVAHTELATFLPYAKPADAQIVVVEDGERIVACWAVLRITHVEGLWIDPAYRGRVSVARRLMVATITAARRWSDRWVMTGAQTPEIARMLTTYGAVHIPMETYVMPIGAR